MPLGRVLATFTAALLLVAGCTNDAPPELVINPAWQEVALPVPPGAGDRIMVRESVQCAGKWYVLGAIATRAEEPETRPVVWVSADGAQWSSVPMAAKTYYGERSILYAAACRDGKIAVIGSKTGGAHGNPRVSTWYQIDDGSLVEVVSHFELYNGPNYMNVARMLSGKDGWMIVGNRMPGAAIWLSPQAQEFEIIEGAPELASDGRGETWAADGVAVGSGWLVVGGFLPKGRIDRDPMSWSSPDGRTWTRTPIAGNGDYEELQRVVADGSNFWAVGLAGPSFGAWRLADGKWEQTGSFSSLGGPAAAQLKSLLKTSSGLIVAGASGHDHQVWATPDGHNWRRAELPAPTPVGAERTISINGDDQRTLLLIDDGQRGRAWFGAVSVTF